MFIFPTHHRNYPIVCRRKAVYVCVKWARFIRSLPLCQMAWEHKLCAQKQSKSRFEQCSDLFVPQCFDVDIQFVARAVAYLTTAPLSYYKTQSFSRVFFHFWTSGIENNSFIWRQTKKYQYQFPTGDGSMTLWISIIWVSLFSIIFSDFKLMKSWKWHIMYIVQSN